MAKVSPAWLPEAWHGGWGTKPSNSSLQPHVSSLRPCRRCSLISLLNYELGSGSLCSCSRLVIPTTLFPHLLIKPGAWSCNKHFKHFF